MFRLKYFTLIFLISISGCKKTPVIQVESKTSIAENNIDRYINELIANQQVPGISIAVTSKDSIIYSKSYGFSDLKLKEKVNDQTLFQIGSITKSFTAISLMQLYDQGKFDPQRPVSDYLDWFNVSNKGEKITGHHLLTHQAGIQEGLDDFYGSPYMAYKAGQLKSYGKLGEYFHYSNIGYTVLHLLVEHLSGLSYQEYVTKNILQPLEMTHTQAEITLESRDEQAIGYTYPFDNKPHHPSRKLVEAELFEYRMGDGSILSTPNDMVNYMQMILGNGTRKGKKIISKKAFDLFTGNNERWYQYGIGRSKHDSVYILEHDGGMAGFSSSMVVDMANGIGVYVSTNTPIAPLGKIGNYILNNFSNLKHDKALPEFPSHTRKKNNTSIDYTGIYQTTSGKQVEIKINKDEVELIDKDKSVKLEHVRKNIYQSVLQGTDQYYWVFKSEDKTHPSKLIYGDKVYYSINYKGKKQYVFPKQWLAYTGVYRSYSPWIPYLEIIIREGQLIAITGFGGETVFREIDLYPIDDSSTFKIESPDSPSRLIFGKPIHGHSLITNWSSHKFYWTDNGK